MYIFAPAKMVAYDHQRQGQYEITVFERGSAYDCLNADEERKRQGKKEVP